MVAGHPADLRVDHPAALQAERPVISQRITSTVTDPAKWDRVEQNNGPQVPLLRLLVGDQLLAQEFRLCVVHLHSQIQISQNLSKKRGKGGSETSQKENLFLIFSCTYKASSVK